MTETIRTYISCDDGNHKRKPTTETINKKTSNDVDDGNHKNKSPDGFHDELSICVYIHIYVHIYIYIYIYIYML